MYGLVIRMWCVRYLAPFESIIHHARIRTSWATPRPAVLRSSHGWEDPLGDPYLDPFHGYAGEDCADAFDDDGLSAWYFDQA